MPLEDVDSMGPKDGLAPVILPVDKVMYKQGLPGSAQRLQAAMDSLGYAETAHWGKSLRVAEALSLGCQGSIAAVAEHAAIDTSQVGQRVTDLRFLFGIKSIPALIDRLLREQFLSYRVRGKMPALTPEADRALKGGLQGAGMLKQDDCQRLYAELQCPPTMPAAIRRAYELQLRTPLGLHGTRRIGFHIIRNAVTPESYPGQLQVRNIYKRRWNITKRALESGIIPDAQYRLSYEPTLAEFAVGSLAALGCGNPEAGRRIERTKATVAAHFTNLTAKTQGKREDVISRLFEGGIFFATRPVLLA